MTCKLSKVVLATGNPGKLKEFRVALADFPFDIISQGDLGVSDAPEAGLTFVENALIKARNAANVTGLAAIADDSGIAVDALDGAPGIYSARYAGEPCDPQANNIKLLEAMKDVPDGERTASFHCVIVYLKHPEDPVPVICHGQWRGRILRAPCGELGFGYDPIFFVPELGKAAAELSVDEKNQYSHRGIALNQLRSELNL